LKTRRIELSNGVWHMVVRGCAQILCKGRKSAKLQEKTEKNSRAVKLYHRPKFFLGQKSKKIYNNVIPYIEISDL
jgi:hypothetical protein